MSNIISQNQSLKREEWKVTCLGTSVPGFTLCLAIRSDGIISFNNFFFLQMTSTCSVHWSSLPPMYGLLSLKLLVLGDCLSSGKTGALASGPAAS